MSMTNSQLDHLDIEATVRRAVTEMREHCQRQQHDTAIRGMRHNLEYARRGVANYGYLTDRQKAYYCGCIEAYAAIVGDREGFALQNEMMAEITAMPGMAAA